VVEDSTGPGRREARERALEILYEADTKAARPTEVLAGLAVAPDPFAAALVTGIDADLDEIDTLLRHFSEGWSLERMAVVDRAVLRIAVYELRQSPDVPTAVVLSEAVELAKQYSTNESGRFVNGVLASVAAESRGATQPDDDERG
jgi:N utilization substance protein B